jgi:hypothetical protein
MSKSNKISIPKEIFENIFFAEGGEKKDLFKALTGEYQFALSEKNPIGEPNAEIEGGEYLFDSQGIRKAEGKTHEKGGMPVKLEDGTKILSDHLKIGAEIAKKVNKDLGIPARATDTYAKVLDRYNSTSGLDRANAKLEDLMGMMKDQKTRVKDKKTSNLNVDYISKQLYSENQKKKPMEKEREKLFDIMFQIQEESKRKAEAPEYKMEEGGIVSIANKYGISEERAAELLGLPKYQNGDYVIGDLNLDGVVDEKDKFYDRYKDLYNTNRELIVNSSGRQDFTKAPRTVNSLPYTPRDISTNPIWKGTNYTKAWQPLVRTSMADPDKAAKIDKWLTENKDSYSPNIQAQLKGLTGEARMKRIEQLATDEKPGPFHNALLQAMVAVEEGETPKETPVEETPKEEPAPLDLEKQNEMAILGLPQRIYQTPTLQPSLKVATRLNRIEANKISPEQSLMETDRAVLSARQNISGLSDAQKAAAEIGLTANQGSASNKAIVEANRFNNQAQNTADIYNAKIGDTEQLYENQNALSYEARTLKGLANYENDWQNLRNTRYADQVNNFKTTEMYNYNNAANPQIQFRGVNRGYDVNYDPDFGKVHKPETDNLTKPFSLNDVSDEVLGQEYINRMAKIEADKKEAEKKAKETKPAKKFGGRFKKK